MYPWSQYNFPFSGDVTQRIDPDLFFGAIGTEAGDGEIEKEITRNKASYGRQLGLITRVLLTLTREAGVDPKKNKPLEKLIEIQGEVAKVKEANKASIQKNARHFLDKLKETDEAAFETLIRDYADKQK